MKRFAWLGLIGLWLAGVMFGMSVKDLLANAYAKQHYYVQITTVIEVNQRHDEVVCVDEEGNTWVFTQIEGWQVGDVAIMVMDDQNTDKVEDDTIITVEHDGHAL